MLPFAISQMYGPPILVKALEAGMPYFPPSIAAVISRCCVEAL
jgi:hypothetical protein